MGFQRLQSIDNAVFSPSVSLRLTKKATVVIHIKKSFLGIDADKPMWERADISIGDGDDAGKLLIEPSRNGLVPVARLKWAFSINIGRIDGIGPGPSKSHAAVAQIVGFAIRLTVPDLPQVEVDAEDHADDEADEDAEGESDDESAEDDDSGTDAAPPPAPKGETFAGVTVDLSDGSESVTNRGLTAEVTKRQAKLVYLLARSRPSGATRGTILNALWDGNPPAEVGTVFDQIITDIAEVLAPLKLAIEPKGVGFKLVDL